MRAASGIGTTRSDLPRIDHDVRDAWLAEAPQPLAESIAKLDDAHNPYQARDGDPALLEMVRALDSRELGVDERVRLLRLLTRRLTGSRGVHPVPELIELLTPKRDDTDALDPVLARYAATDHAVTEDMVELQLMRLIPSTVEIYELPGGRLLRTIRHGALVNAVAFGAAGHDLVSGATDGTLLVTRYDRESIALPAFSSGVDAAAIIAGGSDGLLWFWDLPTGRPLWKLQRRCACCRPSAHYQ